MWPSGSESDSDGDQCDLAIADPTSFSQMRLIFIFLAMWQFAYKVSNGAINSLLRFLKFFLLCLGSAFHCEMLLKAGEAFPVSLVGLHKILRVTKGDFVNYVVCPMCSSVYVYQDCIISRTNGLNESKLCCHVSQPNHPQKSRRKECG